MTELHCFLPYYKTHLQILTDLNNCSSLLCRTLSSHTLVPIHPAEVGTGLQVALWPPLQFTGSIVLDLFHRDPPLPPVHLQVEARALWPSHLLLPHLEECTWTLNFWWTSLSVSCLRGWTPVRERWVQHLRCQGFTICTLVKTLIFLR